MPRMILKNVGKRYGSHEVIKDFNAEVDEQEFLVLLGPSGCGKSTMLRMIAGLTDISEGEILFDGERVNEREPRERNIAFVFQSYALYPHMSVRQNIAFPLIMDRFKPRYHVPVINSIMRRRIGRRSEVSERVDSVAQMLELDELLERRPKALSGGQRQRVALARALVRDPSMYLLDEPLSNLDAKLRTQMRAEISALYQRVRKTFIYVTHDQVEAMTMATRVVVMDKGTIQQIGTPEEIYSAPASTFVAQFIGSPPMNLIPVTVTDGTCRTDDAGVALDVEHGLVDGQYLMGVRPERAVVNDSIDGPAVKLSAYVVSIENLGGEVVIGFRLHDPRGDSITSSEMPHTTHFVRQPGAAEVSVGDRVDISFPATAVAWFDREAGKRIHPQPSLEVSA